jgi:NDP-sugar pyrophosphorylase family protein
MTSNHPLLPVVILAGGLATRLGDIARTQPKCMVDVAGQPFLFHQLHRLYKQGVRQAIICLGHLGEQVVQAVGQGAAFGLEIQYSFDGPTLVGTAGAIRRALPLLPDQFFVLYGDSYLTCPFQAVQDAFQASGKLSLMTVFENDQQWDTSNVEFQNHRILAYDKTSRTPEMKHIDYGLGLFSRSVFEAIPEDRPMDLASLYQDMLRNDQLAAFEIFKRFYEIGSLAGLEETRKFLSHHEFQNSRAHDKSQAL